MTAKGPEGPDDKLAPAGPQPVGPPVDPLADLAVIVPLGPGEADWPRLLTDLSALPATAEIWLVGLGAAPPGLGRARWLTAPEGRGRQLNAGARAAGREVLWFLHADSRLTPGALPPLARAIGAHPGALRYFDLTFAPGGPRLMPLNAWGAWLRSRLLGLPFGDQGFCLDAATFAALGGFPEDAPYGEDHLLVWRAHHARVPVTPVGAWITTSPRKYAARGWLQTTALHLRLTARQAIQAWWCPP